MYKLISKLITIASKAPDGQKESDAFKSIGLTINDIKAFRWLLIDIHDWMLNESMRLNKHAYTENASSLFQELFVPKKFSGKLYYVNPIYKIAHRGSVLDKVITRKRASGIMNWSFGRHLRKRDGYVLETSVPKRQHIILANVNYSEVIKSIALIRKLVNKGPYRDGGKHNTFDSLFQFLLTLRDYNFEKEVITVGLPEVKCKVIKFIKPKT